MDKGSYEKQTTNNSNVTSFNLYYHLQCFGWTLWK